MSAPILYARLNLRKVATGGTVRDGTKTIRLRVLARRNAAVVAFVLAGVSATNSSSAQTTTKTTTKSAQPAANDKTAQVLDLYNKGVAAANKKQWELSRSLFEQAFKLDPRPQIAANLGNAELELGKAREAAEHFDFFLREDKVASAAERAEVEALLKTALGRIVAVTLQVDTEGAELFVNGQSQGVSTAPKRVLLEPGTYTFEAKKDGLETASQTLDLAAGAAIGVKLKMVPKAADIGPKKPKPTPWRLPVTIAAGSVAAIGLGVGIGLTVSAQSNKQEADTIRATLLARTANTVHPCEPLLNKAGCEDEYAQRAEYDRKMNTAIPFYIAGGIGLAGTVVLLVLPKSERVHITPVVGQAESGLVVSGSF